MVTELMSLALVLKSKRLLTAHEDNIYMAEEL